MSINPSRQLSSLDSTLKYMNQVAKDTKKWLRVEYFNPQKQFLSLRLLFVLGVLVKIIFYSHNFHVNKAIMTSLRSWFDLQMHEPSGKNENITNTWRFQSILKTFGIKTQMTTSQKHNNEKYTYESYKSLNNKIYSFFLGGGGLRD